MALRLGLPMLLLLCPSRRAPAQERAPRPAVPARSVGVRGRILAKRPRRARRAARPEPAGRAHRRLLQRAARRAAELRPEILFALKGGRVQADVEGGGTVELDIGLAYLELPVLLRAGPRRGRFRPVLFGGPAPALQIGCDVQIVDPNTPVRATCDETDLPAFRQFDVGLVAGGGLEMRWPQSALSLEARYTTGLRSVLDTWM